MKREPAEPQGFIKLTGVGIPRLQAGEDVKREQVDPAVRGFELAEQADTVGERVFERVLAGRQVLGDEDDRPVGRCALRVYHAVAGRGERDSVARDGQGGQHPFVFPYTDRDGLYDAACGDGDGGVALLEGADTSPPP